MRHGDEASGMPRRDTVENRTERFEPFLEWLVPKSPIGRLLRLGGMKDGAYLVPDDLNGIAACFSPGVANRKEFEDELLDNFGIGSHLLDASSDADRFRTPLREPHQTFAKKWLGLDGDGSDTLSLEGWVDSREPGASDLLLQMDIEGAEWSIIGAVERELLSRFRIIVLELHGLSQIKEAPGAFAKEKLPLFRNLMARHDVVHVHPNNCCGAVDIDIFPYSIPRTLEVTLLRRDRVPRWRRFSSNGFENPHRDDIGWNVLAQPPLFLGDHWMAESAKDNSRVQKRRAAITQAWMLEGRRRELWVERRAVQEAVAKARWSGWPVN